MADRVRSRVRDLVFGTDNDSVGYLLDVGRRIELADTGSYFKCITNVVQVELKPGVYEARTLISRWGLVHGTGVRAMAAGALTRRYLSADANHSYNRTGGKFYHVIAVDAWGSPVELVQGWAAGEETGA